ncbi:MAG TPA: PrsW family intramembrane metalloprotease [Phycicoccus sp.]|nr:PrsW family intramembrane metalloprotease [Phycicoccus sp.]HQK31460.1 PrsW family intramembrane metalloprotease [Phycicoccus sp.]
MTSVHGPGEGGAPQQFATEASAFQPQTRASRRTERSMLRTWVLTGVAAVGFLVAALVISAYLQIAFGAQTAILAVLVAVLPLMIVIPTFLWLDRFEAEPKRYLAAAFLWGALVAAIVAATINTSAMAVLAASTSPSGAELMTAVVVAPFVEEAAKGAFVLIMWWFIRREFDGVIDGMVYAGIAAAGFAFTENIQYLATAYAEGGSELLTATFIGRCIMSPFAHPMFTVLTGIGIGMAAMSRSGWVRFVAPIGGYLLAVLAHALWNLAATSAGDGMFAVYLLVEVPVFVAWIVLVLWTRRREGVLIGTYLRPYADAGWFAPAEVAMLASMPRRREARAWARANAGRAGLSAMRGFQDAASELALLRRKMMIGHSDERAIQDERTLLSSVVSHRRRFVGRPVA